MLLLKACPHCQRGDLLVAQEEEGAVVSCIQCGYSGSLRSMRVALPATARYYEPPQRSWPQAASA